MSGGCRVRLVADSGLADVKLVVGAGSVLAGTRLVGGKSDLAGVALVVEEVEEEDKVAAAADLFLSLDTMLHSPDPHVVP